MQRDVHGAEQQVVRRIVEAHAERRAGVAEAGLGQHDRAAVLVGVVVDAAGAARGRARPASRDRSRPPAPVRR